MRVFISRLFFACGLLQASLLISTTVQADGPSWGERVAKVFKNSNRDGSSWVFPTNRMPLAFGSNYGTQGGELSLVAGFSEIVSVSIAANYGDREEVSANSADISGNFRTKLKMAGVDADLRYHPWENGFFTAVGLRFNDNEVSKSLNLSGNETVKLYGQSYGAQSIKSLSFKRSYRAVAPRLLIGFDNSLHTDKRFGYHLALGFVYQGNARTSYDVVYANNLNPLTNASLPDRVLDASQVGFNSSLDRKFWPIASVGLKIRF